jgi:hypothetical protein
MRRGRDRGAVALGTALVVVLAVSLLGAAVAEIARTELGLARSRRTFARGLAAADACLARVTADLPAGWDHASALAGADGVVGTSDDGALAAPPGCRALLAAGPLGATRPFLDVAVNVPDGGRRVRAVVARARRPVPAVVWTTGVAALGSVAGRLQIDGVDTLRPDLPPLTGIASPDDPALVDAWLAGTPAVTLAGATGAPEYAPAPPLPAVAGRLAAWGAAATFAPNAAAPPPGLYVVGGDLVIATPGAGAGVLYVEGRLDIQADFAFSGIVAASGGVGVATGTSLRVAGAVWLGDPGFDVAGDAVLRHDRAALDAADALFPLPRRAEIAAIVDR